MYSYILPSVIILGAVILFSSIGRKKPHYSQAEVDHSVIYITLRSFLQMRFYLRNSSTIFSIFLSGKDSLPVLAIMNRLVDAKGLFDYIHSVTPQFTVWELQKNSSPDHYLFLENRAALRIVKELSKVNNGKYTVTPTMNVNVWEGRSKKDDGFIIYCFDEGQQPPSIPVFEDLAFTHSFSASPQQLTELLEQEQATLIVSKKWHLKDLADAMKQQQAGTVLN